MPTFHLDAPLARDTVATFAGDDAHHLRDVLRVRVGDRLTVCAAGEYWSAAQLGETAFGPARNRI